MAYNRYSQTSTSKFTPLSLEEVMAVPIYKQQQHEALQGQSGEMAMFDINALEQDKNLANETMNAYKEELDSAVNELNSEGFSATSKNKIIALNRKKQELLSNRGKLGRVQAEYNKHTANVQEQKDLYNKGKISRDKFERGIQMSLAQYKGVAEDGQYQAFSGIHDTDYVEKARKIAKDIQSNPKLIEQYLPVRKVGAQWVDIKTGQEYTQANAIKMAVQNSLLSDSNVVSDLQQREQLGLTGGYTAAETIENLADTFEATYSVDNKTIDMKRTTDPLDIIAAKKSYEKKELQAAYDYEMSPAEKIDIVNAGIITKLNKIVSGEDHDRIGFVKRNLTRPKVSIGGRPNPNFREEMDEYNEKVSKANTPWNITDLDEQESEEFNSIYEGMVDAGMVEPNSLHNNNETLKKVAEYMESTREMTIQNKLVKESVIKTYGANGVGLKASNSTKMAEDIIQNAETRRFYHPKHGVLTYAQMKDKKFLTDDFDADMKNTRVTGYYDADNYLAESGNIHPDDRKMFASPYEINIKGTKFIASRSDGEMNTPGYKADVDFNRVHTNTTKRTGLPYKYEIPFTNGAAVKIVFIGKNNRTGEEEFLTQELAEDGHMYGQPKKSTSSQLRDWMYKKRKVTATPVKQ